MYDSKSINKYVYTYIRMCEEHTYSILQICGVTNMFMHTISQTYTTAYTYTTCASA